MFTEAETTMQKQYAKKPRYRDKKTSKNDSRRSTVEVDDEGGFDDRRDMLEALAECRRWIEAVTETVFARDDFVASIEDGILLCKLLRKLTKRNLGKLNRSGKPSATVDNVKLFLKESKKFGLHRSQLFSLEEFQYLVGKDTNLILQSSTGKQKLRNLLVTIYWLGRRVQSTLDQRFSKLDLPVFTQLIVPGSTELTPPAKKGSRFSFLGNERSRSVTPDRNHRIMIRDFSADESRDDTSRTRGSVLEKHRHYESSLTKNDKVILLSQVKQQNNRATAPLQDRNKTIPKAFVPPYNSRENIIETRQDNPLKRETSVNAYNPRSFAFSDDEGIHRPKHTVPPRQYNSSGVDSEQESPKRERIRSIGLLNGRAYPVSTIPEIDSAKGSRVNLLEKPVPAVAKEKRQLAPGVQKVTITSSTNEYIKDSPKHPRRAIVIDNRRPSASNDSDAGSKSDTAFYKSNSKSLVNSISSFDAKGRRQSDLSDLVRTSATRVDDDDDDEDDFNSISVYRDYVKQRFRERQGSIDKGDMMLRDLLSAGHVDMAKALGLSQELVELVHEEEKFWGRQVELRNWRESQEKRVQDVTMRKKSHDPSIDQEKRISLLRQEREDKLSKDQRRRSRESEDLHKVKNLTIEEMLSIEEEFLAQEAERLTRKDNKKPQRSILKQSKIDIPEKDIQSNKIARRSEPPLSTSSRCDMNTHGSGWRRDSSQERKHSKRQNITESPVLNHRIIALHESSQQSDNDDVFVGQRQTHNKIDKTINIHEGGDDDELKRVSFEEDELFEARAIRLEDTKLARCVDCGHKIRDAKLITLPGKSSFWHLVCFVCIVCRDNLGFIALDHNIQMRFMDSRIHCNTCYTFNGNQLTEV